MNAGVGGGKVIYTGVGLPRPESVGVQQAQLCCSQLLAKLSAERNKHSRRDQSQTQCGAPLNSWFYNSWLLLPSGTFAWLV